LNDKIAALRAELAAEKAKREAVENERDRFQNQLGEKFPTSFGKLDWACGHTGPAACLQCFEGKCASADTLTRELAAKNERLEYLEGQDRSLLEQHQASVITLGDSDLLAVGGRLLDRAERTEALKKVVALSHKADEMDDANTLDYSACLTILAGIKAALPKPDDSRHDKTGEGEKI
jgi:hypothetical protein